MHFANPWKSYRQIATKTATPGQLVLMLYDGAIRFLEHARLGFTMDDPAECNEAINNNILRAQAIIHELNVSLNLKDGGEVALNLRRLYEYMDWRLTESNLQKTEEGLLEIIRRLTVLRDAWSSMLQNQGSDATAESADYARLPQLAAA